MNKFSPLLATLSSGVLFYLSQGIHDVWWLAWFAPAPILWLAYGPVRAGTLALGAFLAFVAGQFYVVECYAGQLSAQFMALWLGIFGALFAIILLATQFAARRLASWATLFAFPVFWTATEYLVSLLSPHGSFAALGYSQVSFPPALQIASLFGLYAITFTLCIFANALALMARGHLRPAALGIALAAASLVFGYIRLAEPQSAPVRVAALADQQAWRASIHKDDPAASRRMAEEYADATRAAAAEGARLIVTPETGVMLAPAWRDTITAPLSQLARSQDVTLVMGTLGVAPRRNVAMSYLPDGQTRAYDKRHLLLPGEAVFTPGSQPGLLGQGRAVAICKDMDFPGTLRADALSAAGQDGIRIMAVPANDFVTDEWIHARMAILRGVENGFAIVRTAFHGLETISDAQGRVIARAETDRPGLVRIIADVSPGPGPTLYTRIGDVFCWLMLLASAALLGLSLRRRDQAL